MPHENPTQCGDHVVRTLLRSRVSKIPQKQQESSSCKSKGAVNGIHTICFLEIITKSGLHTLQL